MKNEFMSGRDFTERINNLVTTVNNGNEIVFIKNGLEPKSYEDARVKFSTGTLAGQDFKVLSSTRESVVLSGLPSEPSTKDKFIIFWDIAKIPKERFTGEIVNSVFYQEGTEMKVKLANDAICTFINCNLDNFIVPVGCGTVGCSNNLIKKSPTEHDDWKCNKTTGDFEEPLNKKMRERLGIHTDPAQMSGVILETDIITKKIKELEEAA